MLRDHSSAASIAVSEIRRAKEFYGSVLGLRLDDGMDGVLNFQTGTTYLIVYQSEHAGKNLANAVVWSVGEDLEAIVKELKSKGVKFEHYALGGGAEVHGDIHVQGQMKLVWFKDPDGNLLHLNNL